MKTPFEKEYDFDEASKEWMKNKIKIGSGTYKYICGHKTTKGKKCLKKPIRFKGACKYHLNQLSKSVTVVSQRKIPKPDLEIISNIL